MGSAGWCGCAPRGLQELLAQELLDFAPEYSGYSKSPVPAGTGLFVAETGGFEPPVEFNPDPSLAVKSIRPLWHVSTVRSRAHPYKNIGCFALGQFDL